MTITSVGYDGTINEVQWGRLAAFLGADYAAQGVGDWKVTAVAGQDRTVRIAPGTLYGHGVSDVNDAPLTLQLPTILSGSRWDLIAARRDWQPPGGATTVVSVQGTGTQQIPAGRLSGPGVLDDQPLALVKVTAGQTLPTSVVDLRTFPSKVITAESLLAVANPKIGTPVRVGGVEYVRALDGSGSATWQRSAVSPTAVSYLAGWYGPAGYAPLEVSRDAHGIARLVGAAANTFAFTGNSAAAICTLPDQFRPASKHLFAVPVSQAQGQGLAQVEVWPDGRVIAVRTNGEVPAGRVWGLGGITYRAKNL